MVRLWQNGQRGLTRRIAFSLAVAVVCLWALAPGLAAAWKSWTGIDPVIDLSNGQQVSIYVEWPNEATCAIQGPIGVTVTTPAGVDAWVVSESGEDFGCQMVVTQTALESGRHQADRLQVSAAVAANGNYPVRVRVSVDGSEVAVIQGRTNSRIQGTVGY